MTSKRPGVALGGLGRGSAHSGHHGHSGVSSPGLQIQGEVFEKTLLQKHFIKKKKYSPELTVSPVFPLAQNSWSWNAAPQESGPAPVCVSAPEGWSGKGSGVPTAQGECKGSKGAPRYPPPWIPLCTERGFARLASSLQGALTQPTVGRPVLPIREPDHIGVGRRPRGRSPARRGLLEPGRAPPRRSRWTPGNGAERHRKFRKRGWDGAFFAEDLVLAPRGKGESTEPPTTPEVGGRQVLGAPAPPRAGVTALSAPVP